MNTNLSALNKRLTAFSAQEKKGHKAMPAPELRYTPFPLNPMQQAYWIGRSNDMAGGGTAIQYYIDFAMSNFDEERFNTALNALIMRHDMLRVVVLPDGTQQVLRTPSPVSIGIKDISSLGEEEQGKRLKAIVDEMWQTVSDLTKWPQNEFRFTITDRPNNGILHCKLDMWCFDGRSSQIFFEELAALYRDPQTRLRPLELRFCDYMRTVLRQEQSARFSRDLTYWKKRLKELPPPPALPMVPPGLQEKLVDGSPFTTLEHTLPKEATSRILNTCAKQGVSLTSFMASAYSDVLAFWSGQKDMTLNFPRFNRQLDWHPDVNDMIGEFASFTLLEIRRSEGSTFLDRTRKLQERMWEDLDHGSVSGLRVLRERIIETGLPEMQAMPIVFTAMPDRRDSRDALEKAFAVFGDIVSCKGATPQVWLDCQYFVLNDALEISWDFQKTVFPKGMVEAMFNEYIRILTALSNETQWLQTNVVRIPRQQFTLRLSQNNLPMETAGENAFRLFSQTARNQPDKPALISGSTTISYGQLHEISLRLAGAILPHAKGNSAVPACVAVLLQRGWEQQAAVMGIEAAGLAYVPIDPAMPRDRLETILAAASPFLTITDATLRRNLNEKDHPAASLDELLEKGSRLDLQHLEKTVTGPEKNTPAYIIFTSGSTGTPKGVTVGHEALLNLVTYSNRQFNLGPDDTVFGITALHHDLSVYDIFGTLAAGARLVLPTPEEAGSPEQWAELTERHGITFWNSVPMYMEQLLSTGAKQKNSLKTVVLGGDWVDPGIKDRMVKGAPNAALYTIGGPTETTVWNIINRVEELAPGWESLPYGRPINNASYHILNGDLKDVPDWVQGEMFCGGTPLCTRASLDEEENQRAFTVHPITGETIYRTGDLGRFRPGGMIEILGRKDFQLNINGYRLDPGEVEQAIARHEAVERAIVTAGTGSKTGNHSPAILTAFVKPVSPNTKEALERGLRQWVNEILPVTMRPRRWVFLDDFPLTPNGKVDRKSLCALADKGATNETTDRRPPKNPVESFLLEVWEEILPSEGLDVTSSFFEAGGDSLKAMQVFARVENKLGLRISLAQVFITPTIEGLAEHVYELIERTAAPETESA